MTFCTISYCLNYFPHWGILFAHMYYTITRKNPRIVPLVCFHIASSWSMMPPEVVSTMKANWWDGSKLFCHFSRSLSHVSNLGLITPNCLTCSWGSNNFPGSVINDFKFTNGTMLHHHSWKTDHDFGAQPSKNLEHGVCLTFWHCLLFSLVLWHCQCSWEHVSRHSCTPLWQHRKMVLFVFFKPCHVFGYSLIKINGSTGSHKFVTENKGGNERKLKK